MGVCAIDTRWNLNYGLSLGIFIRTKKLPYTACFVEAWASRWGEYITGEKAIWD